MCTSNNEPGVEMKFGFDPTTPAANSNEEHGDPPLHLTGNSEEGLKGTRGIQIEKIPIETGPPVLNTSPGRTSLESRIRSETSSRVTSFKS
jgi:hypothetical protein